MRTTIDLPDDVHAALLHRARARGDTLSRTVVELVRESLAGRELLVRVHPKTGLPVVDLGRRLTSEDVAALVDEV